MQTTDQIIEAIRKLPLQERERVASQIDIERKTWRKADRKKAKADFLSLAGKVSGGEVYVSHPDREMLYEDR